MWAPCMPRISLLWLCPTSPLPFRRSRRFGAGGTVWLTSFEVCHKCAVRFDPMCANLLLFDTSTKRFRAGLIVGKLLTLKDAKTWKIPSDSPTLNQ